MRTVTSPETGEQCVGWVIMNRLSEQKRCGGYGGKGAVAAGHGGGHEGYLSLSFILEPAGCSVTWRG